MWCPAFVTKALKIVLSSDPTTPLLGVYPKDLECLSNRRPHSHVYCSTVGSSQVMEGTGVSFSRLMREMWDGGTAKWHFASMRKEILPFVTTWRQLESLILSQAQKRQTPSDLTHAGNPETHTHRNREENWGLQRLDGGTWGDNSQRAEHLSFQSVSHKVNDTVHLHFPKPVHFKCHHHQK